MIVSFFGPSSYWNWLGMAWHGPDIAEHGPGIEEHGPARPLKAKLVLGKLPAQLGGAGAKALEEHLLESTKQQAEILMPPNEGMGPNSPAKKNVLQVGCQTEFDKK